MPQDMVTKPLLPIPYDQVPNLLNQQVHISWARNKGMVWYLREVQDNKVKLETRVSKKILIVNRNDLCYTRYKELQERAEREARLQVKSEDTK